MKICINYCINCGTEYKFQASGNTWTLPYSKEFNDKDYCSNCKKLIINALKKVPEVTHKKWIKTDLINKKILDQWEEEEMEERLYDYNRPFPLLKRVFPVVYHKEKGCMITKEIDGRGEHQNKLFRYSYYESNKELIDIKVLIREDMNGNFIKYEINE